MIRDLTNLLLFIIWYLDTIFSDNNIKYSKNIILY